MGTAADELGRVDLFADLSARQRRKLAGSFRERRFKAGMDVVREGSMGGIGFFVVTDGEATVSVGGVEVSRLSAGDHFGELAMISQRERMATVEALTPMRCHTIQFWDFRAFAKKHPDVMWKLLQHVAGILLKEQSRHAARAESASP